MYAIVLQTYLFSRPAALHHVKCHEPCGVGEFADNDVALLLSAIRRDRTSPSQPFRVYHNHSDTRRTVLKVKRRDYSTRFYTKRGI
jgi:hypothetical protein